VNCVMGGGSFGIQNCDMEMGGEAQNYTYNNSKITPIIKLRLQEIHNVSYKGQK
jgi:hypothetical protein